MALDPQSGTIRWRLHLTSPPEKVHAALATPEGRARFWAESAPQSQDAIEFAFPNGQRLAARILENAPPSRFAVEYFGGSRAEFELAPDGTGGTDLTLTETGGPESERIENYAGWVSVLMSLKAAVDFQVDLRNHDPRRTWDQRYVES